jgi:hypothetical protein
MAPSRCFGLLSSNSSRVTALLFQAKGGLRHKMKVGIFGSGLLVTMSLAVMCSQCAWAQNAKESPIGKWKLKRSCNELRLERNALVSTRRASLFLFSPDCVSKSDAERAEIVFENSNPETIPLDSITAIVREVVIRRPVQEGIPQITSMLDSEDMVKAVIEDPRAVIVLPLYPVVIVAAAGAMELFRGVKTHTESVRVLWIKDGSPRSNSFFLSGRNAVSFLSHLAKATGKNWTKVRFDCEAQDERASQVGVHFDKPISALNITVGAGNYRLLLVKDSDSTRLVYLLSEDQRDVLTGFTAEVSPLGAETPWKLRLARAADGSWCLSELNTDLERLQLRACQR